MDGLAQGRGRHTRGLLRPRHAAARLHRGDVAGQQERRPTGVRRTRRTGRAAARHQRTAAARPLCGRAGRGSARPVDVRRPVRSAHQRGRRPELLLRPAGGDRPGPGGCRRARLHPHQRRLRGQQQPADFELANGLLRDHVPSDLPVYWTPGNHEAGLSSTGGLEAFLAATGRPNKEVFDHKGTRFILLDSHTGVMRTSDWDQVPLLQSELAKAAKDPSVTGVVVSFHHPLHDPSGAAASQLSDQLEADLLKRWLADFRENAGKPVALFTLMRTPRRSAEPTECSRSHPGRGQDPLQLARPGRLLRLDARRCRPAARPDQGRAAESGDP
ncbi:metallophosphoesterase [Streptomyces sp. T1317-0309]|nr:metallophosphoesterase [Streptomyces sp. T1317-0309]